MLPLPIQAQLAQLARRPAGPGRIGAAAAPGPHVAGYGYGDDTGIPPAQAPAAAPAPAPGSIPGGPGPRTDRLRAAGSHVGRGALR